jgi:hypothetical protein
MMATMLLILLLPTIWGQTDEPVCVSDNVKVQNISDTSKTSSPLLINGIRLISVHKYLYRPDHSWNGHSTCIS